MNLNGVIVENCRFGECEETIMKQWYESLFENYAQKYDKECFVQGTLGECDFIEQELNYDKNTRIISRKDQLTTEDFEMLVIVEK